MKKLATMVFALILCCAAYKLCIVEASAVESAKDRIHFYGQDKYDFTSAGEFDLTTYTGTSKRNLRRNGCSAFTFAHGFQWITNKNCAAEDEYYRVLYGLLQVTRTPSKTGNKLFTTYFTDTLKCASATSVTRTEAWMKSFFDQGGAIVGHLRWPKSAAQSAGGHYMLAVGYTEHNGEFLIHMVDSACQSTTSRINCLDFDTYAATVMAYTCGQYWIPLSEFVTEAQYNNELIHRGKAGIWFEKGFLPMNNDPSDYPATPTITDVRAPQELKAGKSFALGGTIKSQSRITDIYAAVTSLTTGKIWYNIRTTPLFYQYTIGSPSSGEAINDKIKFGQLKEDWYQYTISVVTEASSVPYVVHSNLFKVGNPPDMPFFETVANFPPAIAVSIRNASDADRCSLQSAPYDQDNFHIRDIEQGSAVYIGGAVINKHGETWYVAEDAAGTKLGYIFSGDVTLYECTRLFNISAVFTNTEKRDSHAAPYLDSADVNPVGKNADVTVTRFVSNSHGDIWAQLEDGSFLCFYDADSKESMLRFRALVSEPSVADVQKPVEDLKSGSGYPLRGVISANAPIYTVTAHVIDRETNQDALTPAVASPKLTATSVNINASVNGVNINQNVPFGKLETGWYTYSVDVQLGFLYARTGDVFLFGDEQTVITSDFTVGAPKGEPVLPEIPSISGDANRDGLVDRLDALAILQHDAGWEVDIDLEASDVNGDGAVDLQDGLQILLYCENN